MKTLLRRMALAAAAWCALGALGALAAGVTSLPTRTIAGKKYYYYTCEKKETLYSIGKKLNLTQAEIIRYNPTAYDGVDSRTILLFPADDFARKSSKEGKEKENKESKAAQPAATAAVAPAKASATAPAIATTHVVAKGETLYGISRQYGITSEALMDANPSARRLLKAGMTLAIPAATDASTEAAGRTSAAATVEQQVREEVARKHAASIDIAVLLPFDLEAEKRDRTAEVMLEYYKGFLMAVDTLRDYERPIHITAIDAGSTEEAFLAALRRPELEKAQVIIAPDERLGRLGRVAEYGRRHNIPVFNLFAVRDDSYLTNPWVIQANVPHQTLYDGAVEAFLRKNKGLTPVLLQTQGAGADPGEFYRRLEERLRQDGTEYVTVTCAGTLTADDLASLDSLRDYAFVPPQGNQRDLNRLLPALVEMKESGAGIVTIFGYPEWITYRGETQDNLRKLGASFYSRFIDDPADYYSGRLGEAYEKWYGAPMSSSMPRPGMMGFDSGLFLIRALKATDGDLTKSTPPYQGVQNGYDLVRQPGGGLYNKRFYCITINPGGTIDIFNP